MHRDFFEPLVDGPVLNSRSAPDAAHIDIAGVVEDPPERMPMPAGQWSPAARLARIDFAARDAANRDLGRRGEKFVLEFERRRLHDTARRPDLSKRVEWTAQVRGDGAGYDIASFDDDGSARKIEVKTTGLGKYFPFNVTANELRCSEAIPQEFHLYRVFHFGPGARLYMLPGAMSASCHLDPTQYRAVVQGPRSLTSPGVP